MAKKHKKKSKLLKAKRRRYRAGKKAERLDMRQGGRVALHGGGHTQEQEPGAPPFWIPHDPNASGHFDGPEKETTTPTPTGPPTEPPEGTTTTTPTKTTTTAPTISAATTPAPVLPPIFTPPTTTETKIDVKAPTTPAPQQEYGPQDGNSQTTIQYNEDGTVIVGEDGDPVGGFYDSKGNLQADYYWDVVSNSWQPTREFIANEAQYGRIWNTETQDWVDPDVGYTQYLTDEQELARQQRYEKSAADLEAAKKGELPIPQITAPQMIQEGPASEVVKMAEPTKVGNVSIFEQGQEVPTETVVTGTTSTAQSPEAIKASTYTADEINEAPVVDAQTGSISPQALAGMQSQALTKAATGVTVDDETASKALTDRVVGVLSDGAMASEQAVKGLNLPKVLRAKKQLRNAGLTEEQITEIGNDPEALEDKLMEFTEEERGIIGGLPEEALVSTQMDQLLTGLDNGEVPTWARPAVSAVNQMMASRGLDVSTVGRDALFNAIIQSAMPLAQSNAQAIQQSVSQQRGIEAQAELQNAQMRQQTALTNASNVFNMNMAQFNADQQTALSNSKFLQTVTLTNASNDQQAVIQEAASMAQLDLATLDSKTKLAAQNAQSFLAMDMQNLSNRQQGEVLNAQMEQQRLLSNQAAVNAALKFNATSEMQTDQFMANLAQQTRQFNSTQLNAMAQFNTQQQNAAEARRVQNEIGIAQADAQMKVQIDQFNSQQDFARNQWNAQNAQAVEQADMKWRRQLNTANTAAINAVNQQNAQNAFNLSSQAQAFMWQELRDQADYAFRSADNYEQRKSAMYIAMLGNESGNYEGGNWEDFATGAKSLMDGFIDD